MHESNETLWPPANGTLPHAGWWILGGVCLCWGGWQWWQARQRKRQMPRLAMLGANVWRAGTKRPDR